MRDTVVVGAVAGFIGGVVMLAINLILFVGGVIALSQLHQGARAVLPPGAALGTAPALALGLVVTLLLAIILGVVGVYLLRATGRDYAWFKGLLFGGAVWVLVYGLLGPLLIPMPILRPDLLTSASFLVSHLAYGLVTFLVAAQYRPVTREPA
jgi:hypothetical protein